MTFLEAFRLLFPTMPIVCLALLRILTGWNEGNAP